MSMEAAGLIEQAEEHCTANEIILHDFRKKLLWQNIETTAIVIKTYVMDSLEASQVYYQYYPA
jgi:hypothetical protein